MSEMHVFPLFFNVAGASELELNTHELREISDSRSFMICNQKQNGTAIKRRTNL